MWLNNHFNRSWNMINKKRLKGFFLDLVQIDSHSREEKDVAQYIKTHLEALGIDVVMDDAGEKIGGNCGNLLARLRGPQTGRVEPLLFCAHMDTVVPGRGVKPVEKDGIITSSGDTVLGSDDKSGVAAILEMIHILKENGLPFGEIELLFTVAEEIGLMGAKHFDTTTLKSKCAYFLDTEDIRCIGTGAPSAYRMTYRIFGQEAHAGLAPEKGLSAILVAAKAIQAMPLGRIDHETTANIGTIEGGAATNIITKLVTMRGEARSHDKAKLEIQVKAMRDALELSADSTAAMIEGKPVRARIEETRNLEYQAFLIPEKSPTYQLAFRAGAQLGMKMEPEISGGGSDANVFNAQGIESVIIGTGMQEPHTVKEFIRFDDMVACAQLILTMVRLAAEHPS
jgi:tripeptide aminopeptidase